MKKFELWIDESGKFRENQDGKEPSSLIGGVLIPDEIAKQDHWKGLLRPLKENGFNHATKMTREKKRQYVIPALHGLISTYEAVPVFFENVEREGNFNNRELYLNILTEGLLQLLQKLDATHNGVVLDLTIATRVAETNGEERLSHIQEKEYLQSLKKRVQIKKDQKRIILSRETGFEVKFRKAADSDRLTFADFFCNTRFAFRCKNRYFKDNRAAINFLFEKAHLFSLREDVFVNRIHQMSSRNDLSDALMEIFYVYPKEQRTPFITMLIKRMESLTYRSLKSQMKQTAADITAYANQQESYDKGIEFLESIHTEFLTEAKKKNLTLEHFEFILLLQLSDMCLRAGNLVKSMQVLADCRRVQKGLGNYLEEAMSYHQLLEKEAVYAIDAFNYRQACDQMEKVCGAFKSMMETMKNTGIGKERFQELSSEYYGDALCMWIYALIFEFQGEDKKYKELVKLSDIGLKQYPPFEGELERHRQYRSRIEAKKGKFKAALHWLIQASLFHKWEDSTEITPELLNKFFDKIYAQRESISAQFCLMYYVLIMSKAVETESELADLMYETLMKKEDLLILANVKERQNPMNQEIGPVRQEGAVHSYHPMEILLWKLAEYNFKKAIHLNLNQSYLTAADEYYERAVKVCQNSANNLNLEVIGLVIWACRFQCWGEMKKNFNDFYQDLSRKIDQVSKKVETMENKFRELNVESVEMKENIKATKDLVGKIKEGVEAAKDSNGKIIKEKLAELSVLIDY